MNTVGDTIAQVQHLQLKQAVMDEVIEYLAQFVPTDSREPGKGIASPIGGDIVPPAVVEEVRDDIVAEKAKVEAQIQELKGLAVSGAAPAPKKVVKKAPPKRRNSSGKQG